MSELDKLLAIAKGEINAPIEEITRLSSLAVRDGNTLPVMLTLAATCDNRMAAMVLSEIVFAYAFIGEDDAADGIIMMISDEDIKDICYSARTWAQILLEECYD